jgi:hypothetical protein
LPKLLARGVLDRDVTLVAIEDRQADGNSQ